MHARGDPILGSAGSVNLDQSGSERGRTAGGSDVSAKLHRSVAGSRSSAKQQGSLSAGAGAAAGGVELPSADSCHGSIFGGMDRSAAANRPQSSSRGTASFGQGQDPGSPQHIDGREVSGHSSTSRGTDSHPSRKRWASEDSHSVITGNSRSDASRTGHDAAMAREVSGASLDSNADRSSRPVETPTGRRRRS